MTFKKVKIFAPNLNFVAKIHEFDDSQFCKKLYTIRQWQWLVKFLDLHDFMIDSNLLHICRKEREKN